MKTHITTSLGLVSLFVIFGMAICIPAHAFAARIFFETAQAHVGVGQQFEVSAFVDSEGQDINAIQGTLGLPSSFAVESVQDGNSIVAFWAQQPEVTNGTLSSFAGIIPNGWSGDRGFLFSVIVKAVSAGTGEMTLSNTAVLLNDGAATPVRTTALSLSLHSDNTTPLFAAPSQAEDYEPPEPFTITIVRNSPLSDGDAVAVFATQDKGSGIDHYEILETKDKLTDETKGNWQVAESPYRLQDQSLGSYIYVRAIDRVGNIRVSSLPPEYPAAGTARFGWLTNLAIIIVLIGLVATIIWMRKKRRKAS